jgi:predicted SAM-dependent methyltransferase
MDKNIVYNVGAGGLSVADQTDLFNGDYWQEYMVDVAECKPDIVSNIVGLEGISDESADCVWASHVVEHVHWHELPLVFNSILRVLKPSGFAFIMVPDLEFIVDNIKNDLLGVIYQSPAGPVSALDMIYGHRFQIESNPYMQHKTGFTQKSMSDILESLNIRTFISSRFGMELTTILYKDRYPEFIKDPEFRIRK